MVNIGNELRQQALWIGFFGAFDMKQFLQKPSKRRRSRLETSDHERLKQQLKLMGAEDKRNGAWW